LFLSRSGPFSRFIFEETCTAVATKRRKKEKKKRKEHVYDITFKEPEDTVP
jgi:hypothetical protein